MLLISISENLSARGITGWDSQGVYHHREFPKVPDKIVVIERRAPVFYPSVGYWNTGFAGAPFGHGLGWGYQPGFRPRSGIQFGFGVQRGW